MKKNKCDMCATCPIREECDELDCFIETHHSLDGTHDALMEIYAKGKEDGRVEAVEEMQAVIAAWIADIRFDLRGIETRLEDIKKQNHD